MSSEVSWQRKLKTPFVISEIQNHGRQTIEDLYTSIRKTCWKHDNLVTVLWRWVAFLICKPFIQELVRKFSRCSITNIMKENMYWHGRSKGSNFLNKFLRKFLDPMPVKILIIFFCNVNTRSVSVEFSPKIISYLITE